MKIKTVEGKRYQTTDEWYDILITEDEEGMSVIAYFIDDNGRERSLGDFIRTNNTHWNNESAHYLLGLHGRDITQYYMPDYIQLNESGDAVKLWRETQR